MGSASGADAAIENAATTASTSSPTERVHRRGEERLAALPRELPVRRRLQRDPAAHQQREPEQHRLERSVRPERGDARRRHGERHARHARRRDRPPPRRPEPCGVDRERAQRRAAHDRDRHERHADLRRGHGRHAHERRADEPAEEVPERRPLLRRPQPRDPAHQRTGPDRDRRASPTTATRLLIAAATIAESIRPPSCPFTYACNEIAAPETRRARAPARASRRAPARGAPDAARSRPRRSAPLALAVGDRAGDLVAAQPAVAPIAVKPGATPATRAPSRSPSGATSTSARSRSTAFTIPAATASGVTVPTPGAARRRTRRTSPRRARTRGTRRRRPRRVARGPAAATARTRAARLRRRVQRRARPRRLARQRAHEHEVARAARDHRLRQQPREHDRRAQVHVEHPVELLQRVRRQLAGARQRGVGHEHVDVPGRLEQPRRPVVGREVGHERAAADLGRHRLELLRPPARHEHRGAPGRDGARGRGTDPAGRPGHEHGPRPPRFTRRPRPWP